MRRIKYVFASLKEEDGVGVVEVILILVGIFTPYYGVGMRCMAENVWTNRTINTEKGVKCV